MSDASVRQDESLESLVAQVVDKFRERQKQGEQPDIEEYAARHPQAAELVRKVLASWRLISLSEAGGSATAGEPVSGILGDFRLLREVGRGGMGVVYEAEQISLGRRVALKVLPFAATMDTRQLQRFQNEARAAAGLHHTNIVPVHYVGSERGVHYYAMQFIEGRDLASFIAQQRQPVGDAAANPVTAPNVETRPLAGLSTARSTKPQEYFRTVARLGIQAAAALDHAHQLGIVHRDVKPANLLLDTAGQLWVTDFGLAQIQSDTRLTMTGDLVGTLRYMSPEQALAKRVVMDHRTDIYSLGATLYELLTLQPAFDGRDRQELLRQIAFEEPRRPRRLNRAIPVELETIVMKALEKNPQDRYATAQELADDLRRFLDDQPIQARRPSLVLRGRKWFRRHLGALWSVAGMLLLLALASMVGTLLVYQEQRRTQTGYDEVAREQRRTQAAYEKVLTSRRQVNHALWEFQQWAIHEGPLAPKVVDARNRPLVETLVKDYEQVAALDGDDEGSREIIAYAYLALAVLRQKLGQPAEAEKAYRQAIELYQALLAANPTALEQRKGLFAGWNNMGDMFRDLGRLEEAEDALRTAVVLQRQLVADYPEDNGFQGSLVWVLRNLGLTLRDQGKWEAARQCFDEAIRVMVAALKVNPQEKDLQGMPVVLYRNQADTLFHFGEHTEVSRVAEQMLPSCKTVEDFLAVADLWWRCVLVADRDVRLSDAERRIRTQHYLAEGKKAGESAIAKSGNHPEIQHSVARSLILICDSRPSESSQALAMTKQVVKQFPQIGIVWNTLGIAHYRAGEPEAAIKALKESIRLRNGGDSFDFFFLAMAHWQLGDKEQARKWYDQAVQWMEKNKPQEENLRRFRPEAAELLGIKDVPPAHEKKAATPKQ